MSGTALGFQADRMTEKELFQVAEYAQNAISHIATYYKVDLIPYFAEKESFGDADVLVMMLAKQWSELIDYLRANYEHVKVNGSVASFGVPLNGKIHQVDLIYAGDNPTDYWVAYDYFSYNDLGNLVGRLAHRLGFKYGHDGLRWIIRDSISDTKVICDMNISKETHSIYKFLDLDYSVAQRGFDTREEIFEFVSRSKYFHPDIFLLENRNATSRRRDSKRETYNKFLEWCANYEFPNAEVWDKQQLAALKNVKLDEALYLFNKRDEYTQEMYKYHQGELAKTMYNGDLVREWVWIEDKPLGEFMKHMRTNGFDTSAILSLPGPKAVETFVKSAYAKYKDTKDE